MTTRRAGRLSLRPCARPDVQQTHGSQPSANSRSTARRCCSNQIRKQARQHLTGSLTAQSVTYQALLVESQVGLKLSVLRHKRVFIRA
eukprot:4020936-Prymnesium_polylepis.1